MRRPSWTEWALGWLIAVVLVGGVTEAVIRHRQPQIEIIRRDVFVLGPDEAKVTGTITAIQGIDVVGPILRTPIELTKGTATIHTSAEGIVWDGGRPLRLDGDGGIDLGPATVSIDTRQAAWLLDGIRVLVPGRYVVNTPVAVGTGGLASPQDDYSFTAGDDATIEATSTLVRPVGALHLEGPGSLILVGRFEVVTRDGRRTAERLEFGPGPFVLDLRPDLTIQATLQGPLEG